VQRLLVSFLIVFVLALGTAHPPALMHGQADSLAHAGDVDHHADDGEPMPAGQGDTDRDLKLIHDHANSVTVQPGAVASAEPMPARETFRLLFRADALPSWDGPPLMEPPSA
jgi:hypothetical protein